MAIIYLQNMLFILLGPIIYDKVTDKEIKELQKCYINSLNLAKENKIRTIAFPCISTGEFRFPKEQASKIAIESVGRFLDENRNYFDKVVFNVYEEEDYKIYERNIKKY